MTVLSKSLTSTPAGSSSRPGRIEQNGTELLASLRQDLLRAIPSLRGFAMSLCYDHDRADDLVQETLMRAIASIDSFEPGTNIVAWLFTILGHQFYSLHRKHRREIAYRSQLDLRIWKAHAEQSGKLDIQDLRRALHHLPEEHREALILVGASGLSYDEAAAICGCPAGTIKSRVNRARAKLTKIMHLDRDDTFGPSALDHAAIL